MKNYLVPSADRRSSRHRLRLGLRRSLICFAPLAVVPQRQILFRCLPSPLVFQLISTHFTATLAVPAPPSTLKSDSISTLSMVKPWYLNRDLFRPPTHTLRPMIPDNACTPRITATAGTEFVGAYSPVHVNWQKEFTIRKPSSSTRRRVVRLSSIANYSRLLPPVGVWPVSQCHCG